MNNGTDPVHAPCPHDHWDGAEGPAETLGRPVLLWECQGCGTLGIDTGGTPPGIVPVRAKLEVKRVLLSQMEAVHLTRWSQFAGRIGALYYGEHMTAREVLMRMGQVEKEFPVVR